MPSESDEPSGGAWIPTNHPPADPTLHPNALGATSQQAVQPPPPGASALNDTWGDREEVFGTQIIDCNEPHDFETFATVTLGQRAETFPGDDEVAEQTYQACVEVVETYIGRDFMSSPFDVYSFTPTRSGWALGDRAGTCMLYRIDGAKLLGPVKPSA